MYPRPQERGFIAPQTPHPINNFYEPALPVITTSCPPDLGAGLYRLSVGKHRLIWNPPLLGFRAGLYRLSVGKHRLIWNPPLHHWSL
ncbi:hypothetical protein VB834_03860 [Limnoraphis robusta Tam1]|uniref:hypothetical protein n=1 Tax=Limnoraphis robusta TaxID=1118279 RepID=UPI002B21520F|nr:hypothetical protein [Limnoraphis robusta]MEA5497836.1 hypothetical protein [Limnoraphis robusta BA-68 BA1]MEA5538161.1 hypothetical protein [Limnoraphis robusta Tam1]